jgi:hypothetical protein
MTITGSLWLDIPMNMVAVGFIGWVCGRIGSAIVERDLLRRWMR